MLTKLLFLQSLAAFGNLQKLVLRVNKISADTLLHIVQGAGQHLQTLKVSIEQAETIAGGAGEGVMAAILKAVPQLTSLRYVLSLHFLQEMGFHSHT